MSCCLHILILIHFHGKNTLIPKFTSPTLKNKELAQDDLLSLSLKTYIKAASMWAQFLLKFSTNSSEILCVILEQSAQYQSLCHDFSTNS